MTAAPLLDLERHFLQTMANHLWQSTLYLACASVAIVALNKQPARIRYGLWLSATAKFLIPFFVFRMMGIWLAHFHKTPPQQAGFLTVVRYAGRPFAPADSIMSQSASGLSAWLPGVLCLLWMIGSAAVLLHYWHRWNTVRVARNAAVPVRAGREFNALRSAAQSAALRRPMHLLLYAGIFEPGIVGVFTPSLLWPVGITEYLGDDHLETIMLHEAWHVRRHDNLTSMLQMLVEVVFWFHPLVWWLGSRLISERERACDEAVLECGSDPRVYAESILKASEFCVDSALACISGVTGSDLKQRMVRIMTQQGRLNLSPAGKLLLSMLGIAVIAAPVVTGVFSNRPVLAAAGAPSQANLLPLETSTIRRSHAADKDAHELQFHNGDLTFPNVTVRRLIEYAYDLKDYQLTGGPDWIKSERYDIAATWRPSPNIEVDDMSPPPPPPPPGALVKQDLAPLGPYVRLEPGQLQFIIKAILATRFGLQVNSAPRNLPGFAMEIAASGSKLPKAIPPQMIGGEQVLTAREMSKDGKEEVGLVGPVGNFADMIAEKVAAPVTDRTGLTGTYDMTLNWTTSGDKAETIRTALEQQLGLELVPVSTPVQMLNVQQIRPPTLD